VLRTAWRPLPTAEGTDWARIALARILVLFTFMFIWLLLLIAVVVWSAVHPA
jgi:hypothetical protein